MQTKAWLVTRAVRYEGEIPIVVCETEDLAWTFVRNITNMLINAKHYEGYSVREIEYLEDNND